MSIIPIRVIQSESNEFRQTHLSKAPEFAMSIEKTHKSASLTLKTLLLITIAVPLLLLILILQAHPEVRFREELNAEETRLIEELIVNNSPSRFSSTGERVLSFNAEELNLLAAFGRHNLPQLERFATDFDLRDATALITLSTPWPFKSMSVFLNIQFEVEQTAGQLRLTNLHAGDLRLPGFAVDALSRRLQKESTSLAESYQGLADLQRSIRHVELRGDLVDIHLQWEPDLLANLRSQAQQFFISADDRERILYYYGEIAAISMQLPPETRNTTLQTFMPALFDSARSRSSNGGDAVAENRTLLQALSLFVNHLKIEQLVSDLPESWDLRPRRLYVTLQGRSDLSQHFISSAAIAASAGVSVAEVLSNSKEVYDARYRSGFSFSDMTANIAGMALGAAATESTESARLLQNRLADAEQEYDYMPATENNTDGISEQDFSDQYNDRNNHSYQNRLTEIEQQVADLPVYQQTTRDSNQ